VPASAEQLGPPIAYLALKEGTPVYDRDGERIGVVEHVEGVSGIFEGIVVHTYPLPGRHVFAAAHQIAEIRERGVLLRVRRHELREVSNGPRRPPPETLENPLLARLRRAWDWIARHLR
jgi:hypothetical protein